MKLKRKELDESNHHLSDFPFSSPASKIRRLDSELPPIIEDEEVEIPPTYGRSVLVNEVKPLVDIEELPMVPENEERAIVLFQPRNNPQFHLSNSYLVDSNLISSFKNDALLSKHWNAYGPIEGNKLMTNEDDNTDDNTCRAVIPWAPSHHLDPASTTQTDSSEPMEAEEASMEIEEMSVPGVTQSISHSSTDAQHQWQQQHCMIPQAPPNTTTPLVWYR